jgi:hypothetical protein
MAAIQHLYTLGGHAPPQTPRSSASRPKGFHTPWDFYPRMLVLQVFVRFYGFWRLCSCFADVCFVLRFFQRGLIFFGFFIVPKLRYFIIMKKRLRQRSQDADSPKCKCKCKCKRKCKCKCKCVCECKCECKHVCNTQRNRHARGI